MTTVQQRMQNFRAGQAAYNQFARNVARLPALIKEYQHLLREAEKNLGEATVHEWRVQTPGPHTAYHQRKLNSAMNKVHRNFERRRVLNAEIINAKRRILTMIGRRHLQQFGPGGAITQNGTLRAWNPLRMIAAIRQPAKNKIYRAALRHAARPRTQVPKMVKNNKGRFVK